MPKQQVQSAPRTMEERIKDLEDRRAALMLGGGLERIEKHH
jgi:hypothetical protein